KAIALDPNHARAHNNLGAALMDKGKVAESIPCYEKAIAADPKLAEAHANLGVARFLGGQTKEARESLTRASRLLPDKHPSQAALAQTLRACEHFRKLGERLPRRLRGEDKPRSAAESLDLANLCRRKQMHAAAARFDDVAFTAEPALADDLKVGRRGQAAASAVLAGTGKGRDAGGLDDAQKAGLGKLAPGWLKAGLAARAQQPPTERAALVRGGAGRRAPAA